MPNIPAPAPPYLGPPRWKGSATNKPIKRIVMHCAAGAEPGTKGAARGTANYSKNTSRPSSWHYCADAEETVQLTYDSVVAYHCGWNDNSIGYELCCSLTNEGRGHWQDDAHQAMLRRAAKDVAQLCLAYNVPIRRVKAPGLIAGRKGITGHVDVRTAFPWRTTHWDPGPAFPWDQFMRLTRAAAVELLEPPPPVVEPLHWPIRVVAGNFDFTNQTGDDRADLDRAEKAGAQLIGGCEAKDRNMAALLGKGWTVHQDHGSPARAGSFLAWRDGIACTATGVEVGTRALLRDLLPRWFVWADLMVDGTTVRYVSAHFPPKRHWKPYWNRMARRLRRFAEKSPHPVVVMADWNKHAPEVLAEFGKHGGVIMFGVDGLLVGSPLVATNPQRLGATRSDHDFVAVDLAPVAAPARRRRA